jgi:hypothetical protein
MCIVDEVRELISLYDQEDAEKGNRQGAKAIFKWLSRADSKNPLGVLGVMAVRSSV